MKSFMFGSALAAVGAVIGIWIAITGVSLYSIATSLRQMSRVQPKVEVTVQPSVVTNTILPVKVETIREIQQSPWKMETVPFITPTATNWNDLRTNWVFDVGVSQ